MNNKKLGSEWERVFCGLLADYGYWVHFITPDARGAQPFDIIAMKDGRAIAIDCKTCSANNFTLQRLEYNQIFAFEKWIKCGGNKPLIAVLHDDKVYMIDYTLLRDQKSVKLTKEFEKGFYNAKEGVGSLYPNNGI